MQLSKFCVAAALSAALVLAQPGPRNGGGPPGTPPDPATMIQMRVSHLTALLSLTTAQQAQATTIFTNAFNSAQSVQTSLQADRQSLADAVKADNTVSIDQIAGTIGTLQGQLTAINSKADAAFYAILTADQKAKYDSLPHGGPGGGFGPPGPGPQFRGGRPPQ
jgi:Spy/CpxP family protein refolding chaperone